VFALSLFNLVVLTFTALLTTEVYATDKSGIGRVDNPVGQVEPFSFVVWGHPQRGDGVMPLHFEEILDRISELNAEFLVITGDVINGMWGRSIDPEFIRADWDRFDEGVKRLGIPVYRVPGNHDVHNFATRDIYLERYTRPPFAFTYKGSRFILLDTVGIDQRTQDGRPDWNPQELPFDNAQLTLIRNEIEQQDNYNHVFFFMHHVQRWREPSGLWWENVHPILKGGKTRAVFSGTPGNPGYKYDHIEQDDIHYIDSCTFPTHSIKWYKEENNRGNVEPGLRYQPDNLQFVRVEGDQYAIRTMVVGEWRSKNLSSRFWAKVDRPPQHLKGRIRRIFKAFRRPTFANAIWGGVGLFAGLLIAFFWQRRS